MRIIAGDLKGRRLHTPAWDGLRPTSDRLRETLFNVLAPRIRDARFLDGYGGTGAVGIEALSRGAAQVTFVERDPRASALIATNLERCGVRDRHAIIRTTFAAAVAGLATASFDIIFLDPPYGRAALDEALESAAPLMRAGTVLAIEHARRDAAPAHHGALARTRVLTSGDSALGFYRLPDAAAADLQEKSE
jgi:16S rRNA (guanine(966)-N(2))-methyltransferase RsmD